MNHEQSPIKDKILSAIQSGQVKMRPRWHFILQASLTACGVIIVLLALLFLTSFIVFSLRQSGVWFTPTFGYRGLGIFITSLPWLLIGLAVIFMIILEILVKKYSFAYRQPLLYSVLSLVLLVTFGGLAVARTPLHSGLLKQTRENRLPLAEPLYRGYGMMKMEGVHAGSIEEMTENGFVLNSRRDERLNIIVTPETQFPGGYDLVEGDLVIVMGPRDNGNVSALGIRKIEAMPGELVPYRQFPQRFKPPLPPR